MANTFPLLSGFEESLTTGNQTLSLDVLNGEIYSVVDWFSSLFQILVPDFLISPNQEMLLLCVNLAMSLWDSPSVQSISIQAFVPIHFQPTFFIPCFSNPKVYIFCFYFLQFYLLFLRFSFICFPL